jgi:hypothetical protein
MGVDEDRSAELFKWAAPSAKASGSKRRCVRPSSAQSGQDVGGWDQESEIGVTVRPGSAPRHIAARGPRRWHLVGRQRG